MSTTLIWQLAARYVRGKRSANAVPVLSRISMVAIAVSSAAMIVVFSVFNGMEGLVKDLYTGFYPDMRITIAKGKFFTADKNMLDKVRQVPGVQLLTTVIEDNAIINNHYNKEQKVIVVKGIDRNYLKVNDITETLIGEDSVSDTNPYTAIAGISILNELGTDIANAFSVFQMYYPNAENTNVVANPMDVYRTLKVHPGGAFHISDDFDDKYVLAALPLVQQLFHKEGQVSSVELKIDVDREQEIQEALKKAVGPGFVVETRYEQNKTMFMVMRTEKWVIYAILILVLLIASFNMVGALSMLVLEKQKDIGILKAMGALPKTVRLIFILEGVLWSLIGGVSGMLLGVLICVIQQQFGIVKLAGSMLVDAWPVTMNPADFVLVIVTIIAVGTIAAWFPAARAAKAPAPTLKSA